MPPAALARALGGARKVVEVGTGPRFGEALAWARALPGCTVVVTDTDPRVLEAPPPLEAALDDLTRPRLDVYQGASLLYGVRLPAELHAPLARLAARVGAQVALRVWNDEAPAMARRADAVHADTGGAWHVWRSA